MRIGALLGLLLSLTALAAPLDEFSIHTPEAAVTIMMKQCGIKGPLKLHVWLIDRGRNWSVNTIPTPGGLEIHMIIPVDGPNTNICLKGFYPGGLKLSGLAQVAE